MASSALHALLIISDSALPLGSFAYSNGLESFLAHDQAGLSSRQATRPKVIDLRKQPNLMTDGAPGDGPTSLLPEPAPNGLPLLPLELVPPVPSRPAPAATLTHFLTLSLRSVASTTLPFLLAAHRHPTQIFEIDDQMDATVTCCVTRKASVTQGRALIAIWDRSLRLECEQGIESGECVVENGDDDGPEGLKSEPLVRRRVAAQSLSLFSGTLSGSRSNPNTGSAAGAPSLSTAVSSNSTTSSNIALPSSSAYFASLPQLPSGHLAPLYALLGLAHGLSAHTTAFTFLFSHARAVTSAAVRSGLVGPYLAQTVLASGKGIREEIDKCLKDYWDETDVEMMDTEDREDVVTVEDVMMLEFEKAAQEVPVMDLWTGRHGMLYSRLFNS